MRMSSPAGLGCAGRVLLLALAVLPARSASASDHAAGADHGAKDGGSEGAQRTDVLDLGAFRIRSSRVTDQEVVDVRLAVYLVLSSTASPADFHRLEQWRQRLRDQVVIAVRGAAPEAFAEASLRTLQRRMLFRIKRLPTGVGVIGVYITDFSLDEGETLADELVLPITPSAAPKKPAASGGH